MAKHKNNRKILVSVQSDRADAIQMCAEITSILRSANIPNASVKTEEGFYIVGFDIEEETQSNGKLVYNLIIRTKQGDYET